MSTEEISIVLVVTVEDKVWVAFCVVDIIVPGAIMGFKSPGK